MSASSQKNSKEHSILAAPIGGMIHFILKYHIFFLFLMIAGAVWAGLYAREQLKFKNRRLDLINPKSEWNQYWLDYISKFGSEDDLIIVLDGESPEKIIAAVNETAEAIELKPNLFYSLFYKFDDSALLSKALYFASDEELQDLNMFLKSHEDVFHGNWNTLSVDRILPQTVMPLAADPEQIPPRMASNLRQALERMIFSLENALGPEYRFVSPFPEVDISKAKKNRNVPQPAGNSQAGMQNFRFLQYASNDADAGSDADAGAVWDSNLSDAYEEYAPDTNIVQNSNVGSHWTQPDYTLVNYIANYPPVELTDPYIVAVSSARNADPVAYQTEYPSGSSLSPFQTASLETTSFETATFETAASATPVFQSPFDAFTESVPPLETVAVNTYVASNVETASNTGTVSNAGAASNTGLAVPSVSEPVRSSSADLTAGGAGQETVQTFLTHEELEGPPDFSSNSPMVPRSAEKDSHIHYMWLNPDKTAIMMVKMVEEKDEEFARGTKGIDALRTILQTVQKNNPGTKVQLTGLPVMENDEMRSSQNSMGIATWLSILGVALLYVYFFRELRHPMMAMFALFIGIGWSMAYVTFFIGHLNILSISFAVILIGLGIDFGIHYTSRYLQCRSEGDDTYTALIRSGREIGPGIVTGALTTAAAFYMAGLTEFTGIAELGIIAGGGVLACCIAALTVLPIFIYMMDKNRKSEKIPVPRDPVFFHLNPKLVFTLGICCFAMLLCGLPKVYYDYNLLNLQPEGLESVELEKRLIDESKQSVWYAISMSDNEEVLRERIEKFTALPSVDHVEQIVTTIVPDENPLVRQIHDVLTLTPANVDHHPVLTKEDALKLYQCLEMARRCLMGKTEFASYFERIETLQNQLLNMKLTDYFTRMTEYQESLANDLLAKLNALEKISSPEPPSVNDIPKPYLDRMRSSDGTYLLKIYGKGDLWNMDNLRTFVEEVRSVDPRVTGNPLQTYECSLQMKKGYQDAAVYALGIVVILLLFDLRSIQGVFFAMIPVTIGILSTLGIMGLCGIPLNAANMIVLPLIIGIGIDDGVHILHDFRNFYRGGVYRISNSTSMSVILTSLTTILSFGTLILAQHRGLQSLGFVLGIGTTCCWLASLLMLPATLNLVFHRELVSESPLNSFSQKPTLSSERSNLSQEGASDGKQELISHSSRENELKSSASFFSYHSEIESGREIVGRSATCYTRDEDGVIVNRAGRVA